MKYTNTVYNELQSYIKDHHGFNMDDLKATELYQRYESEMESIKQFAGKRVEITFTSLNDWLRGSGKVTGKIVVNDRINFLPGKHTKRCKYLDAGLYDGWYATLIPLAISEIISN